jgi:N-methylhydantoinase A
MSDVATDFAETLFTQTSDFDFDTVNAVLDRLRARANAFIAKTGGEAEESRVDFSVEARYPQQIWELEVPVRRGRFDEPDDVETLRQAFHDEHREVLAIADVDSSVETITWRARATVRLPEVALDRAWDQAEARPPDAAGRDMYFSGAGVVSGAVASLAVLAPGEVVTGPGVIESPATTIVLIPGSRAERLASGSIVITNAP